MSLPDTCRSRVPSSTSRCLVRPGSARTAERAASRNRRGTGGRAARRCWWRAGPWRPGPLLPLDPAEVGAGVEVAGAHVGQPGLPVDVAGPLRQPQPGLVVAQPHRRAHVHPADGVHQPDEAEEVDLQVVVDPHPGGPLDGGHRQRRATEGVGGVQLVATLGHVGPVGAGVGRDGDVRVAREADDAHRPSLRRDVHQQHRVRATPCSGGGGADVQAAHVGLRHAGTSVRAHQEEVVDPAAFGAGRSVSPAKASTRSMERADQETARSPRRRRRAAWPTRPRRRPAGTGAPSGHPGAARSPARVPAVRRARGLRCGGSAGDRGGTGNEARADAADARAGSPQVTATVSGCVCPCQPTGTAAGRLGRDAGPRRGGAPPSRRWPRCSARTTPARWRSCSQLGPSRDRTDPDRRTSLAASDERVRLVATRPARRGAGAQPGCLQVAGTMSSSASTGTRWCPPDYVRVAVETAGAHRRRQRRRADGCRRE